jgi:hypothetical protein
MGAMRCELNHSRERDRWIVASDYMGTTNAARLAWMRHFVEALGLSPSTYMIGAVDVASILGAVDLFDEKLNIATAPSTRNSGSVAEMHNARAQAVGICRQYAKLIKYNAGIDDQAKLDAGIKPPTTSSEPVDCPMASPLLGVVAATNGAHTLGFKNSVDLEAKGKPFGAIALQLYRTISEEPVTDWSLCQHYGIFTRNPIAVTFEPADNQKIATYFARWSSRRGGFSNWSPPVSMAIAA